MNAQKTYFTHDADGQRVYTLLPDGRKIYTPWPDYEEELLPGTQQTSGMAPGRVPKDGLERQPAAVTAGNLLQNPGFEDGKLPWRFNPTSNGSYVTASPGYSGSKAAKITITANTSDNNQFYQNNITLKENTAYRLSFVAKSSDGKDAKVYIHQFASGLNYGLNNKLIALTTAWKSFSFDFTTSGFSGTVSDGNLRFWFKNLANVGTIYYFDDVVLEEIGGGGPTSTPTATNTPPGPTATNTPPGPTPTPNSSNLVHHYKLDESSGGTAHDSAGSRDGTLNGPTWQPSGGQINGALRFDGVDDRVDLGAFDLGGNALTIAFWMKANDFEVTDARFISKATGVSDAEHYWMVSTLNSSKLRFRLKAGGETTTLYSTSGTLSSGQWTHVAATYDGSRMRLYKNGQEVADMAKSGSINSGAGVNVALGNQPAGAGDRAFDGLLDDVCIYERALSGAELAAIKDNGCGGGSSGGGSVIDLYMTGSTNEEIAELLIDDQVVATYTNMGTGYNTRQFNHYIYQHGSTVTPTQVKVRFTNDGLTASGQDKNVRVDRIEIDGVTYQTEAPTTFSTGTWSEGTGCDDDFKQSERLACTGYFWYYAIFQKIQRTTYSIGGQTVAVRVVDIDDRGQFTFITRDLYYLYTDHLGSVTAITDDSGNLVGGITRYEPFGGYRGPPPTSTNPSISDRGFTGHQENRDIGLTYMRARWFMPEVGRFLSPDTIVPDPLNPQSFNRYSYTLNNPVKYSDPSGHCVVVPPFDTAACAVAGFSISAGTVVAGAAATVALAVVVADAISPEFNPIADATTGIVNIINDADDGADDVSDLAQEIFKNIAGNVSGNPGDLDPDDFDPNSVDDTSKRIEFDEKQLKTHFKHANQFGVEGNPNPSNFARFRTAIEKHIHDPGTVRIEGEFRNHPAIHYYNPDTGLNVFTHPNNRFWSGWRLSPEQAKWLIETGKLGGG